LAGILLFFERFPTLRLRRIAGIEVAPV